MSKVKQNFRKHLWYYLSFILIQILGFTWVMLSGAKSSAQFTALMVTTGFYILWALTHQYIHHNLTTKIVIEYMLIGSLGFAFSIFLFSV